MSTPTTHKAIIELWPNKVEFAKAIGVKPANARKMHQTGVIPPRYFHAVVAALEWAGFPPLTYAQLADMARAGVE